MSAKSSIEWTDRTWNPVRGCSVISPGCINCYAMKQAHRFSGDGKAYAGLTKQTKAGPQWTGKIATIDHALLEPLSWRSPARVFVNSMSDLFHEDVPTKFIDRVFAVMALCPQHTFQILTKRPARMRQYVAQVLDRKCVARIAAAAEKIQVGGRHTPDWLRNHAYQPALDVSPPLPNVWLGVSVENQKYADERIPLLLETPAAIRFISAEPLLGPIDFSMNPSGQVLEACDECGHRRQNAECDACLDAPPALDWVIVGGESGNRARPFDIAWARSIVRQCADANVACFVKQIGVTWYDLAQRAGVRGACVVPVDAPWTWMKPAPSKGGDMAEWPADLRVRQFPAVRA